MLHSDSILERIVIFEKKVSGPQQKYEKLPTCISVKTVLSDLWMSDHFRFPGRPVVQFY